MVIAQFKYQEFFGLEIQGHITEVAHFRIKYFCEYPYLYVGTSAYEQKYLQGYCADPQSILIQVRTEVGSLVAVSTAIPLVTKSDILTGASEMFQSAGFQTDEIYYYGKIILDHSVRGKGIASKVYSMQEKFAKQRVFNELRSLQSNGANRIH